MFEYLKLVWNKHLTHAIIANIVKTIINATPLYCMYQLTVDGAGQGWLIPIFVYPILTNIVDLFYNKKMIQGSLIALKGYIEKFSDSFRCCVELNLDKELKEKQQSWLSNAAHNKIDESYKIIKAVTSGSSVAIIGSVVMYFTTKQYIYPIGYLIGALVYVGVSTCFKNKTEDLALQSTTNRNLLTTAMNESHDNVLIGNEYNINIWSENFSNSFTAAMNSAISYSNWTSISNLFGKILIIVPIIGGTTWMMWSTLNTNLLLASLPIQVNLMEMIENIGWGLVRWNGMRKNLMLLEASLKNPYLLEPEPTFQVKWERLTFTNKNGPLQFNNVENFLTQIKNEKGNRITIRGDNGAGKSILMSYLAKYLITNDKKIFYRPCYAKLAFLSQAINQSSGERASNELRIMLEQGKEEFILIDEWDANLDENNIKKISSLLDKVSENKCIIEIRHRDMDKITPPSFSSPMTSTPILISFSNLKKYYRNYN